MRRLYQLLIAIPFILYSCDTPIEPVEEIVSSAEFQASFSGTINKEINGEATFVHNIYENSDSVPDGSSLAIELQIDSVKKEHILMFFSERGNTSGIKSGAYKNDISLSFLGLYAVGEDIWGMQGDMVPNIVTLSVVKENQIEGEFTLNLINHTSNETISITGTFDALGTTTKQ